MTMTLSTSSSNENKATATSKHSVNLLSPTKTSFASHSITRVSVRILTTSPKDSNFSKRALENLIRTTRSNYAASFPTVLCPICQLTRPGDWRYEKSPLERFDWNEGCIRLQFDFDDDDDDDDDDDFGGRSGDVMTIGIISLLDCATAEDFVAAQNRLKHLDNKRIFVFDSFAENSIDMNAHRIVSPNELVAFPPFMDERNVTNMHLSVIVNDLALSIFLILEDRIKANDEAVKIPEKIKVDTEFLIEGNSSDAGVVEINQMTAKEKLIFLRKRELARRQKLSADFCLLIGSPLDAYQRYDHATQVLLSIRDMNKQFYALSLEGKVASLVAMADVGGHGVDKFLDTYFQCPKELISAAHSLASNPETKAVLALDRTKSTLPETIYIHGSDALDVMATSESMSSAYCMLLIKLARYAAESEDSHLCCRWGEGGDCYKTHVATGGTRTSNSSMALVNALIGNLDDPSILSHVHNQFSLERSKKCSEYLHRAVSTGGLNPELRAGVALFAARLCLTGTKCFPFSNNSPVYYKPLPRKAGFFMLAAAESYSSTKASSDEAKAKLWLSVSKLYSGQGNTPDEHGRYAWSTLRTSVLQKLVQQNDPALCENALELLIIILSELTPNPVRKYSSGQSSPTRNMRTSRDILQKTIDVGPESSNQVGRENKERQNAKETGERSTEILSVAPDIRQVMLSSSITKPVNLPLFPENANEKTLSLRCSKGYLRFDTCNEAQRKFLNDLVVLRKTRPTLTQLNDVDLTSSRFINDQLPVPPPLDLVSASIVPLESHLTLERTKAVGSGPKKSGSLSTFFNPYSKKSDDHLPVLVAEGEERIILVRFNNKLGISLDVPSCQLEFSSSVDESIEAPPLSFTIPAKSRGFVVRFPFNVVQINRKSKVDENCSVSEPFELLGLRVTVFDRCFFLALSSNDAVLSNNQNTLIPLPSSVYNRRGKNKYGNAKQSSVKIESVPPQPKLLVSFENSFTPLDPSAEIPIHLCDGEIFTIPSFRLENDHGSSGEGKLVQLQMYVCGLPGLVDELLYDSHGSVKVECDLSETMSDDFEELMDEDGLPPLRVKVNCDDVSLDKINEKDSHGSIATFQMAAAHDLGRQLEVKKSNIRLRFRYRGLSNDATTLIWRRRELKLNVVRVKGPRISSITFRPDLSWGSAVYELSKSLEGQIVKSDSSISTDRKREVSTNFSGDEIVLLVAVANECKLPVILSNKAGRVGGFEGAPMSTLRITSGVSVKIPVVIQRISLEDEQGEDTDVAQELINRTALQWVSEEGEGVDAKGRVRTGRVRIPQRCLKQLISDHEAPFRSKICHAPVSVRFSVNDRDINDILLIKTGKLLEISVLFNFKEWVSQERIDQCTLAVEFCCARKEVGGNLKTNYTKGRTAYYWCGQVRKYIKTSELKKSGKSGIQHFAKLTFLRNDSFVVSACARLTWSERSNHEEIWWAPRAYQVRVVKQCDYEDKD